MSRIRTYVNIAGISLLVAAAPFALAQYVGRVDTSQDTHAPTLRATAVLEYTGDLSKPTASRLVPIAVWDGERYQPGGLYLAQPVPLTVQAGTQYVLQVAGTPKELFNVNAASDTGGSWIAIGTFAKPAAPKLAHLRPSRIPPQVVSDDKPHFAHVPTSDTSSGSAKTAAQNAPPVDPDRPTLHHRDSDGGSPTPADTSGSATASAPSVDPNRPRLHEEAPNASDAPETATDAVDPNRPKLSYGRPANLETLDSSAQVQARVALLSGTQQKLEEIAAVSDAVTRQPHSYVYSWNDPQDQKKAQAALEEAAQQLLAKASKNVTKPVTHSSTAQSAAVRRAKKPLHSSLPTLTDESFNAYELSYGGGATLVFSATSGSGVAARYITLIAELDFNGTPLVLFKQITSQRELDIVPRMKLVDAVDTDADNRAELIFALESSTGRQYAIYRVADNTVTQVFPAGA
jgi:hypothetical protein